MRNLIKVVFFLLLGASPLAAAPTCVGDCDQAGTVTVDELVKSVGIALGGTGVEQCLAVDGNGNEVVTVDELVMAVNYGLNGCPTFAGEYSGSVDLDAGRTATMNLTAESGGTAEGLVTIADESNASGGSLVAFRTGGGGANPLYSFSITGSVNLDTGAYSLSGSFVDLEDQTVPVNASGVLPQQPNGTGTFVFELGPDIFNGTLVRGSGSQATPTRTPASGSTPTVTVTPGSRPTPAPGCGGGYGEATFSNASGVNANQPLSGTLALTKVTGNLSFIAAANLGSFGGTLDKCPIEEFGVTRGIGWGIVDPAPIVAGKTYALNQSGGAMLPKNLLGYSEATAAPSLQKWTATSGTLTVESIVGDTVTVRVSNARMEPGAPFLFGPPPLGTFTLDFTATIDAVQRP